jgi:hypothetical protein
MTTQIKPYGSYADIVSKFNLSETIFNGLPQTIVNAVIPINKNVLLTYFISDENGLSLTFKRYGIMGASDFSSGTKYFINLDEQRGIDGFASLLKNGTYDNTIVIFCSDDPSERINDPRIRYDSVTNTYEIKDLPANNDSSNNNLNTGIQNNKNNIPNRLFIVFKKSNPNLSNIRPMYVNVTIRPNPKQLNPIIPIPQHSSIIQNEPINAPKSADSLTSVEIFLIVGVSLIIIAHIIEIIMLIKYHPTG